MPPSTALQFRDHDVARRRGNPAAAKPVSADDMLIFSAVAREGGVRRGAQALSLPRSTVSRQLAALERSLGGQLVSRSTRRFALTELGHTLQVQCARLEDVLKVTRDELSRAAREPSGTLKVAASPVVGEELLPPVIADYLRRFPQASVDVSLSVDFVDLRNAGFDLAIRTGPLQEAGDLFATRLGVSSKGLYASRAYLKRRGAPQAPADLAQHDCIVVGERRGTTWGFRSPGSAELHLPVTCRLRVDSYRLARSGALDGLGIARLPSLFARELVKTGELVPVLEPAWTRTTLYAVHTAGQPAPVKIRAFIELLRGQFRDEL
jgi:DNA-binding transcriptional LysR family regulator